MVSELKDKNSKLTELNGDYQKIKKNYDDTNRDLATREKILNEKISEITKQDRDLAKRAIDLERSNQVIETVSKELQDRKSEISLKIPSFYTFCCFQNIIIR